MTSWHSYIDYRYGKKCLCAMIHEWLCDVYLLTGKLLKKVLVSIMEDIIDGMMGYIPLHVIMEKILADHGSHPFGDFRPTILNMLSAYGYERTILVYYLIPSLELSYFVCSLHCVLDRRMLLLMDTVFG